MTAAYTTRELKKWDVYYLERTDEYGGRIGRPGIIISPDRKNQTSSYNINVIFLTTSPQSGPWYPEIRSSGRKSYAVVGEINTVRRREIGTYICTLTSSEIAAVESAIKYYLELTDDSDALARMEIENEELKKKIAELESKAAEMVAEQEKRELDHKVHELAYDKVLDRLVDKQIELDLLKRGLPVAVEEAPEEKPLVEPVAVEEAPELIDINRCTERDLMTLGFGFSVARNITAARPFMKVDDLRIVPGVTRVGFGIAEKKITVGDVSEYLPKKKTPVVLDPLEEVTPAPIAEEKVNINTASAAELHLKLGLSITVCYSITGTRKREGLYKSIEDLLNVPKFTERHYEKYKDMVCV